MAGGLEHPDLGGPDLSGPDLGGVAGEMRSAWRAEQEDATADAATAWRHGRTLADWLTERMHAGDRVAVTLAERRFTGLVNEVGADLIVLDCAFGRVDVHLVPGVPIAFELDEKARRGGSRAASSRTFRDALITRDAQPDTSVGTLHEPEGLDGTLYVGRDFVSVVARMGAETVIPLDNVVWVSARRA